jgi:hypothetical protein
MKKFFAIIVINLFFLTVIQAQTQPIEMPSGYRFQYRIKGPEYKNSRVLELAVDEYGNYLVATFRVRMLRLFTLIFITLYLGRKI